MTKRESSNTERQNTHTLFKVHELDMSVDTSWLHLTSAVTWAPYVGFIVSSATCPVYGAIRAALAAHAPPSRS